MVDLENLISGESQVVDAVDRYIQAEQDRLAKLKEIAQQYHSENKQTFDNRMEMLGHPVNAFLMLKRLTTSWEDVEALMRRNTADVGMKILGHAFLMLKRLITSCEDVETLMRRNTTDDFIQNITDQRIASSIKFPGKEDLDGAGVALLRLQDTYNLPAEEIASGRIRGIAPSAGLSARDCFELCKIAYNGQDYYHTLIWAQEAMDRAAREEDASVEEVEMLEYLAYSLYQQGNTRRALVYTKRLYELDPDHPRAEGNIRYYSDLLKEKGENFEDVEVEDELPPVMNPRKDFYATNTDWTAYEGLCRDENNEKGAAFEATLYCHYKHDHPIADTAQCLRIAELKGAAFEATLYCHYKHDHPIADTAHFLRIAPVKVEIVHWQPKIMIFRNAISDAEIEILKELAAPRLKRATVKDGAKLVTVGYRIAKSAWLKDHEHEVVHTINRRIDMMTDLEMATAEELQMANYGLGGHYEPHFDMSTARDEAVKNAFGNGHGNRIATLLFYLEAPEAGGATIFNRVNVTLFPTKYDAAFWHNVKRDGEPDLQTRHAACPVLSGQKWVANKWIHERGQEFRRKCALDVDEYE